MNAWDKVKTIVNVIAAIVIPIILAVIGNNYTKAIKSQELSARFIELSVKILMEQPTDANKSLRDWAVNVINRYSEEPLSEKVKSDLITNLKIIESSRFEGTGYKEVGGNRNISEIIILDTQSDDVNKEITGLKEYGVAYHYLIDRSGEVRRLVDESDIAFHTQGRNASSIAIGLIHVWGTTYTERQLAQLENLLADIVDRYHIDVENIFTGAQVSSKKSDLTPLLKKVRQTVSKKLARSVE